MHFLLETEIKAHIKACEIFDNVYWTVVEAYKQSN